MYVIVTSLMSPALAMSSHPTFTVLVLEPCD